MIIDFTTTAMNRPNIIDRTYASFSENLEGVDLKNCRLFINIDPLPKGDREEVTKVSKKYFGEVFPNYPNKPNFTAACNWIWSNAKTEYIFHIEDDWILLEKINISDIIECFQHRPKLLEVALRAYNYHYKVCPLSPCVMHKRYYKAIAGNLNEQFNPEVQLRGINFGIEMPSPVFKISEKGRIVVYPENKKTIIIRDIGRPWMKSSEFVKSGEVKKYFNSWELKK